MDSSGVTCAPALLDTVLMLFRKDLRLDDNPALLAATQAAQHVVPVFIWAPEEEGQFQPGRCSKWWLKQTLRILAQQLESISSQLIIRQAQDSTDMLLQLLQETGAQAVFFNHLFDPISLVRDHNMKQRLAAAGCTCRSYNADVLYEPWAVLDDAGEPFHTFQSFWDKLQSMSSEPPHPYPAPTSLPAIDPQLMRLDLDDLNLFSSREQEEASNQLANQWHPGSADGLARLEDFLSTQLADFSHNKAKVDRTVTSRLSPWIHYGSISVRHIYHRVRAKQREWLSQGVDNSSHCQDFIKQLAYREYSRYLSFHFPFLHERPLLSHLRCVPWNLDQHFFKAWKMGLTGVPLVDAAMKELWSSGWMHNRLRVICGEFAVKHLLLPWQWGLKHFWDALLDADLESDALGWQYVAGCMTDAPDFGNMLDITAEAAAFDPDGEYVRRWLPVLARLPTPYVHAPWTAPQSVLVAADVELGFNYPTPLVIQQAAEARLAQVAAFIQQNLAQQQQQQQQQDGCREQQTDLSSVKQPYRPATQPLQRYTQHGSGSGGAVAAAAAAAADIQKSGSVLYPQQPPQDPRAVVQENSVSLEQAAAVARQAAFTAVMKNHVAAPQQSQFDAVQQSPVAAEDLLAGQPDPQLAVQQQHQQRPTWQQLAVEGDIHLRQQQRQRHRLAEQQQRQQKRRKGAVFDRYGQQQQRHGWYGFDDASSEGSVESEVFSSVPVVSDRQPTACSWVQPSPAKQEQQQGRLRSQQQQFSVGQELSKEFKRQDMQHCSVQQQVGQPPPVRAYCIPDEVQQQQQQEQQLDGGGLLSGQFQLQQLASIGQLQQQQQQCEGPLSADHHQQQQPHLLSSKGPVGS